MAEVSTQDWRTAIDALRAGVRQHILDASTNLLSNPPMARNELGSALVGLDNLATIVRAAVIAAEQEAERYHELRERLEDERA